MSFPELLSIEFRKLRRSHIGWLLVIAPALVVSSGVAHISQYFTPEYTDAWSAMFIQSALLYAYYLLPLTMVVACALISGRETQCGGLRKMLSLPIDRRLLSLSKFCVLVGLLLLELALFFLTFLTAGGIATRAMGVSEAMPLADLLRWCAGLFATGLPALAVMWMICALFEKPLISIGLNLLLIIPGVLAAATPLWPFYPYCYSGYLVSCSLHAFTSGGAASTLPLFPLVPCAIAIAGLSLALAMARFGLREAR
ncbi:MAG: ABC transporter permease [Clostridia bacterium]|nr:ABC transporter permease [Clostridia bacterium]